MKKVIIFFILLFTVSVSMIVIAGFLKQNAIKPLSEQIDMKTGKANINWVMIDQIGACVGDCRNSSSSSRGGGYGGGK